MLGKITYFTLENAKVHQIPHDNWLPTDFILSSMFFFSIWIIICILPLPF